MLKKLLRYDLKSVFKYWWIAAVASIGVSIFGGFCLAVLTSEPNIPTLFYALSGIGIFISIMGMGAFMLTSTILIFVRFYKNFFTDEGYLTFTLPVRRSQLLNSKLIMSIVANCATAFIFFVGILIFLLLGFSGQLKDVFLQLEISLNELLPLVNLKAVIYGFIYIIEFLLFVILSSTASTLFLFGCITFSSIITKKAKVITAIGIYYVANSILSGVIQFLYLFGISAFGEWFANIPNNMYAPIVAIVALVIIAFMTLLCLLLYLVVYWMLDRKLNLT